MTLNLTLSLPTTTMMFKMCLPLVGMMVLMAGNVWAANETRVFKMGLLTPWHLGYDFSGYTSASAVTIAMEKVHSDPQLNANGRIRLRYGTQIVIFIS